MRHVAALLLLAVLPACSGEDDPRPCVATRECRPGERCQDGWCKAREARACTTDTECGAGGACIEAACVGGTACRTTADCGSGESCDAVQGLCTLSACDAQGGCPNGGSCNFTTNRCGPRRACQRDDQCSAPKGRCDGGYCAPGCGKTGCGAGLTCLATTGRCGTANPCTSDAQCSPPSTICEATACVPGCASAGCTSGTCNTATGRCQGGGGCSGDGQCNPPLTVCEGGSCVSGCLTSGCSGGATCDDLTGRCAGDCNVTGCPVWQQCNVGTGACEARECHDDLTCSPPGGVCDSRTSRCTPGCTAAPCAEGTCDTATGRCGGGGGNASCTRYTDCADYSCVFPGVDGASEGVCAKLCSRSDDCPARFACLEPADAPGVKVCLGGGGAVPPGGACTRPGDCQSTLCAGNPADGYRCARACSRDEDCPGDPEPCVSWPGSGSSFVQACRRLSGLEVLYATVYPETCYSNDGYEIYKSVSMMCADGQGQVAFMPCCTASDCFNPQYPNLKSVCTPMQPWYLDFDAGYTRQSSTWMKGCAPAQGAATDPMGAACALADGTNCASNLCLGTNIHGAATTPYCSSFCCSARDCPGGYACVATYDAAMNASMSLCVQL